MQEYDGIVSVGRRDVGAVADDRLKAGLGSRTEGVVRPAVLRLVLGSEIEIDLDVDGTLRELLRTSVSMLVRGTGTEGDVGSELKPMFSDTVVDGAITEICVLSVVLGSDVEGADIDTAGMATVSEVDDKLNGGPVSMLVLGNEGNIDVLEYIVFRLVFGSESEVDEFDKAVLKLIFDSEIDIDELGKAVLKLVLSMEMDAPVLRLVERKEVDKDVKASDNVVCVARLDRETSVDGIERLVLGPVIPGVKAVDGRFVEVPQSTLVIDIEAGESDNEPRLVLGINGEEIERVKDVKLIPREVGVNELREVVGKLWLSTLLESPPVTTGRDPDIE